ncbi:hypothetical protein GCM10028818_50800 [Spirosoma horti]
MFWHSTSRTALQPIERDGVSSTVRVFTARSYIINSLSISTVSRGLLNISSTYFAFSVNIAELEATQVGATYKL